MAAETETEKILAELSQGEGPVLETLAQMHLNTLDRSGLDERTYLLVRFASLVAMDAAPASYFVSLATSDAAGISADEVRGVLAAIAPVVGSARVVSAASNAVAALQLADRV